MRKNLFFPLLLIAVIAIVNKVSAQGYLEWNKIVAEPSATPLNQENYFSKVVNGYTYVLGTSLNGISLPTTDGSTRQGINGNNYLAKFDPNGNRVFSTFISSPYYTAPNGLEIYNGKIVVYSYIANLGVSSGFPAPGSEPGKGDLGLSVYNDATGSLEFARFVGGSEREFADVKALAVDATGIYVSGYSASTDFVTTSGPSLPVNPYYNDYVFVRKYSWTGNLIFSRFLHTPVDDDVTYEPNSLAVANNVVYIIAGTSNSNYPVTDGSGSTIGALPGTKYVLEGINATTGDRIFAKYIPGSLNTTFAKADASGYVAYGYATENGIPHTVGQYNGKGDLYLFKYSPSGQLIYGRFFGGSESETQPSNLILENGYTYIAGITYSPDFQPVLNGFGFGGLPNNSVPFIAKLDASGNIIYSSCWNGNNPEDGETQTSRLGLGVSNGEAYLLHGEARNAITTDGSISGNMGIVQFGTTGVVKNSVILPTAFHKGSNGSIEGGIVGSSIYWGGLFKSWSTTDQYSNLGPVAKYYFGAAKYTFCPTPASFAQPAVSPASQSVCVNGLVGQLTAPATDEPANAFPTLYKMNAPYSQNTIVYTYQWQSATNSGGPWTDIAGATEQNYSPPPGGVTKYFKRITKQAGGCAPSSNVVVESLVAEVIVDPARTAPTVDAGGGATGVFVTCPSSPVIIGGSPSATAAPGGSSSFTYSWTNTPLTTANPSVSATASTIYTLTVTDGNGCKQADQAVVNILKADAGPDKGSCNGAAVQIGTPAPVGLAGVSYAWVLQSGNNTGTLSSSTAAMPTVSGITGTTSATYRVTMTVTKTGGGTCSSFDDVIITPRAAPATSNIAGPDQVLCLSAASTTLGNAAEAGFQYRWSPTSYIYPSWQSTTAFQVGNIEMPSPNPITYLLAATQSADANGYCTTTDEVTVVIIEARAGEDGCGPRIVGMPDRTPNISETYLWEKVIDPLFPGNSTIVGANNLPQVPVTESTGGDSKFKLTVSYTLNGVTGTCVDEVIVPTCGCQVVITPVATYGCPSNNIPNNHVKLVATPPGMNSLADTVNFSYSWTPAVGLSAYNTRTVTLTDATPRTYTVTITNLLNPSFTCSTTQEVNNPNWTVPVFNAPDPIICANVPTHIGEQANNPNWSYSWDDGSGIPVFTGNYPEVTLNQNTNYTVTVVDNSNNCKVTEAVNVTVAGIADAGYDKQVCDNGVVTLGTPAVAGNSYSWSLTQGGTPVNADYRNGTSATSAQPEVFVASGGTGAVYDFTVTVTGPGGCQTSDAVKVTANPLPTPITLTNLTYCPGASPAPIYLGRTTLLLSGTSQIPSANVTSYDWSSNPAGFTDGSRNPVVAAAQQPAVTTTYTVTINYNTGCSQQATQTITVSSSTPDAGLDQFICPGSAVSVGSANNPTGAGITYAWTGTGSTYLSSATSPNPTFSTTVPGTYTLTLKKTENGCVSNGDAVTITVENPNVVLAPYRICTGSTVQIGPSPYFNGGTYSWSPTTGLSDPNVARPFASPTTSTVYQLTVTTPAGCKATSPVEVLVSSTLAPSVTVPNVTACMGASGVKFEPVVSPAGNYTYSWSPYTAGYGSISSGYIAQPTITTVPVGTGTYTLTVTDPATGCSNMATNVTYTITDCSGYPVNLFGNVFIDLTNDNTVNGTGVGVASGIQLYISLVGPDGKVVASVPVSADGTYGFLNITGSKTYSVVLSTRPGTVSLPPPAASLPPHWANTGEHLGASAGNDGTINGVLTSIAVGNTDVFEANLGISPPASIGDRVWRDDNKNGIQDTGEPGVAGITITLYRNGADGLPGTADDVVVGSTVTDSYGNYLFTNLAPSTSSTNYYNVGFTLPANYQFTTQTNSQQSDGNTTTVSGGSTAANGSDANISTGRTGSYNLSPGENDLTADAGIVFGQPATNSLGNYVWFDSDNDGEQDGTEAGIAGVTVTLYASNGTTVVATTITDATGHYSFTNLPANTDYIIGVTPSSGLLLTVSNGGTTPANNTTNSDVSTTSFKTSVVNTGAAGTQQTGLDAGFVLQPSISASLGDKVWNDLNANGVQDADEPGVAGVTVNLYKDANGDGVINGTEATTPYLTTVTDAFGNYIFNNLSATATTGTVYQVGFVATGYTFTTANAGGNDNLDSDPNTSTGLTDLFNLKQGAHIPTIDAGVIKTGAAGTASLGDYVWFDANKNGQQDNGEIPVGGVTVTLYNNSGNAIATTFTDANGKYLFANLAAGDYSVGFNNLPSGYSFTPIWLSDDTNTGNSDVNPGTGRTGTITLSTGEAERDVDAGLVAGMASGLGSLGNYVWYDDGDGIQELGEMGIAGITVTLLNAGADGILGNADDGPSQTTVTNALGQYIFTGLPAGNYAVQFGTAANPLPSGYTTNPNQGTDDAIDSDGGAIASGISTTGVINLAQGEDNLTIDLCLTPPAGSNAIGNYVWFDKDPDGMGPLSPNGIQDVGEMGVYGVSVYLYKDTDLDGMLAGAELIPVASTTTDMSGKYLFAGLPDGSYLVQVDNLPAGYYLTQKYAGNDNTLDSDADPLTGNKTGFVDLDKNSTTNTSIVNNTLDVGISTQRAALGNFVWLDTNGDGIQAIDGTEPGVAGVTVTLYRPGVGADCIPGNADDELPAASMITDQSGFYRFDNLFAGNYVVQFTTIPDGLIFTTKDATAGTDATDSDADPAAGLTASISLAAGEVNLTVDAGLFKPKATIGNYVWADDGDGIQETNENGVPGILVSLIDGSGKTVAVTVTDGSGGYLFTNVAPGTYSISFSNLPDGTSFTSANQGSDDEKDSDVEAGNTITGITVTSTTYDLSFDAGLINVKALPVTLLSFTGEMRGCEAQLKWSTAVETNFSHFEIEYSQSGNFFKKVDRVDAKGSYSNYSTVHQPEMGKAYYRLKVIDMDGKYAYSNVLVLANNCNLPQISIFPNPAHKIVFVKVANNNSGVLSVKLYNGAGQLTVTRTLQNGENSIALDKLAKGNYHLIVSDAIGNIISSNKLLVE